MDSWAPGRSSRNTRAPSVKGYDLHQAFWLRLIHFVSLNSRLESNKEEEVEDFGFDGLGLRV